MTHPEPFSRKMKSALAIRIAAASFILLGLFAGPSLAAAVGVDQSYTPALNWGLNIEALGPIGQSFTPTQDRFNWAEFWIDSGYVAGTTLQVKLHEGASMSSTVLGLSDTVTLDKRYEGIVHFDFASAVSLTPGSVYSLEAVILAGGAMIKGRDNWGVSDPYAGGTMFDFGRPNAQGDLWFGEGFEQRVPAPVPEPGTMMLLGSGLAMAAAFSGKRFRR
jgi:hypothetical protein